MNWALVILASAFSFAQFSIPPFVQRVENKKLLKNGNKIGVFVGYHLETQIDLKQKIKKFCKVVEFYPLEIPNQWKVLFKNIFANPVDFCPLKFRISKRAFEIDPQNNFFKKISKSFPKPVDKSPLNVLAIRGTFFQTPKTISGPDVFYKPNSK